MPIGKVLHQTLAVSENTPYPEDYKEQCFLAWYQAGKPRGSHLLPALPEDMTLGVGRKPTPMLVSKWKREFDWDDRAAAMDEEARKLVERQAIEKRAEMFQRHAEVGEILVESGIQYILEKGIDSPTAALRAIDLGKGMEERALGVSEMLIKVATMDNESLLKLASGLLTRVDIEEDIVDAEIEEIEDEDESE